MTPIPLLLSSALALMGSSAFANTPDYGEGVENWSTATTLYNSDGSLDHWKGIGRLTTSNVCTATLLDTQARSETNAPTPAYVLTSGNCIDLSNGKIITNQPITGTVTFNFFSDRTRFKRYNLKTVKWRSMQGVDMAIIELDVSLQTLMKQGIQPLKMASATPTDGSDVLIVGVPEYSTLQMAACTVEAASDVVEGKWTWRNNLTARCADFRKGSSGSPLLDRYSNNVIGIVGTTNNNALLFPCDEKAPCVRTEQDYLGVQGNIYGHPVAHLNRCFRKGVMVENSCELYPTFSIETGDKTPPFVKKIPKSKEGDPIAPTWDYRFSIDTAFYRHKTVSVAKQCENPSNYSAPISSAQGYINTSVGSRAGRYFLCIIGTQTAKQKMTPGLLRNALSIPVVLTGDEPAARPELTIKRSVHIERSSYAHEHTRLVSYKVGPSRTTDCNNPEGYMEKFRYFGLTISEDDMPATLCTIAYDVSDVPSDIRVDRFEKTGEAQSLSQR